MTRNYLAYLIIPFVLTEGGFAKKNVDCRVLTGSTSECNQYGSKLIRAKEVAYEIDRKKLIISKTLPVPKKAKIKIISVADMIEKYVNIEDSLRFKGSQEESLNVNVIKKLVSEERIKEKIKNIHPLKQVAKVEETVPPKVKNTHPLPMRYLKKIYGVYHVESGDVLSKIATKFGVTSKELLRLNHLDEEATVHVGEKFTIPLSQKVVDAITHGEYIVETGDTLLFIAHKFKVSPKDLVNINHIKSNMIIREGKKLLLPLPYVLKKIESDKKRLAEKKKKIEKEKQARIKAALKKRKLSHRGKVKMIRGFGKHKLRVTATAYSSHRAQTDKTPFLAAWNNRIRPGMKIIAVSRDLLTRYGLRNGSRIRIGGLRGYYVVRDKMNKRFRKRIDIYMGVNRRRALRWGRRSVIIYW
jgi:LysM repeat protein